jgi:metallo-beta-lactamase class B
VRGKVWTGVGWLAWGLSLLACGLAQGQESEPFRSWNQPFEPFRIVGNLYYVGANDITSYLVATPEGHVLIDGGLVETVPIIRASVARLGFRMADVRILLNSHAHFDHSGGLAALAAETGARLMIMDGDAEAIETGGAKLGPGFGFPPVEVDRVLHDGDVVELGGTKLAAHKTPGHTRGCTTWAMTIEEAGRSLRVVLVGSPNVLPDTRLAGNPDYPEIAEDYRRTFRVLEGLDCDVFLGAHGSFFGLIAKAERLREGGREANPFVDPQGYRDFVAHKKKQFLERLAAR